MKEQEITGTRENFKENLYEKKLSNIIDQLELCKETIKKVLENEDKTDFLYCSERISMSEECSLIETEQDHLMKINDKGCIKINDIELIHFEKCIKEKEDFLKKRIEYVEDIFTNIYDKRTGIYN
jgi:hypothetical protein